MAEFICLIERSYLCTFAYSSDFGRAINCPLKVLTDFEIKAKWILQALISRKALQDNKSVHSVCLMAQLTNYVKSRGTFISRHVRTACHLTNEKILNALHVKEHTILRKVLNVTQKILLKMFWLTIENHNRKPIQQQSKTSAAPQLLPLSPQDVGEQRKLSCFNFISETIPNNNCIFSAFYICPSYFVS